ncbi:MAG: zinc metalloprotease HtpX [Acidimicrobiia bacterium]|nr:zinc metalloprotease HtpX [Acidimicrobiia bacterium]MDH3462498.1 zinc metalloprotease HtpX [Acidimicrobiia bacterium]
MNNLKTVGLLAFMSVLVALVVQTFSQGFVIPMLFVLGLNVLAFFFSDKLALASTGARPVTEQELPEVYSILRNLSMQAGMPMPSVHVIDSPQPNAFATGRSPKKAAVAVTTGILQTLNRDELEGVLAHELAHVGNRDILISSVAAMMAAALSLFARMAFWFGGSRNRDNPLSAIVGILSLILAPFAAMLIRFAISRTREFQADETGATLTGRPMQLAYALEKIAAGTERIPMSVNPATSQLFIDNPLKAVRGQGISRLLSTHPPTEERIERLTAMAQGVR